MRCAVLAILLLTLNGAAAADDRPLLLRDVGLSPHPGAQLPLDAVFKDETGEAAPLGRWLENKPTVLSLVYFGCPMLCGEVMNALTTALKPIALAAVYQATNPWCSVIVRKAFGVAGAGHSNHTRASTRYAWPSGEWGSLPIEGGVEAAYKRQIQAADDPDKLREELEAKLATLRDPILTAEAFGIEEIIDPRDTRPLLIEFARRAHAIVRAEARGPKSRGMRP